MFKTENHDPFVLREHLARETPGQPSWQLFLRALSLADFGDEQGSAAILRGMLATPDAELGRRARFLLMLDDRALFHYAESLQDVRPLLLQAADHDLLNRAQFLQAVADVPPQTIEVGPAPALWGSDISARVGRGRFPFVLDTAAAFSVLTRSAARSAGLRIRGAGYEVESAAGEKLRADLAVGDLQVGENILRNVLFLVLPEGRLGAPFAGAIGVPVLRALGSVHYLGEKKRRGGGVARLAWADGGLVIEAALNGMRTPCRLDTGANRTSIAPSLAGRFESGDELARRSVSLSTAGGTRALTARELPLEIEIAGTAALLQRVVVLAPSDDDFACRLGADAMRALAPLTLDFARLRLVLE